MVDVKEDKEVLMTPVHPSNSDPHVARNCSNLPVCSPYRPLACGAMVSAVFVSVVFSCCRFAGKHERCSSRCCPSFPSPCASSKPRTVSCASARIISISA